jgi:3-oxoacyl-[acyl-carrier-protein] synthase-1
MTQVITITDIGLCTPLGTHPEEVLAGLIAGDTSAMTWREDLLFDAPCLVGMVNDACLIAIPQVLSDFSCRNNRLLNTAAEQLTQAVEEAKLRYGAHRIGVVLGTSTSGIAKGEAALAFKEQHGHFPPHYHYSQQELGSTSQFIQEKFSLNGPCYTLSTACSSSAKVFASAQRLLNAGLCDVVIVGGVDSLCQLTLNGFKSLESISKQHCNPFSEHRDGINIGEGAALFLLEKQAMSDSEPNQVLLAGVGESADAHHISAPHPQGAGAIAAMHQALADANITPEQISYVNLHGTATPKNDAMESRAMASVFGESIPPCSSTKPIVGHTLGAAGAIEAAFCYLLLSSLNTDNLLPPHLWDLCQDPQDPLLPLVAPKQVAKLDFIMSNSFAFGGSNASVIFCRKGAMQHV